jgi:hypothetical protein
MKRIAVLLFLVTPAWLESQEPKKDKPPTEEEIERGFRWFDGLGYPDLAKMQLVKVSTGEPIHLPGRPPTSQYEFAFLVKDDGPRFQVLTLALQTRTYIKRQPNKTAATPIDYEPIGLEKALSLELETAQKERRGSATNNLPERHIYRPVEMFVCARACTAHGKTNLATEWITESHKAVFQQRRYSQDRALATIKRQIAHGELRKVVDELAKPGVSRQDVIPRFKGLVRKLEGTPQGKEAGEIATVLEKMAKEDETRAQKPPRPFNEMTKEQKIGELIYRLRDQRDFDPDESSGEPSVADKLRDDPSGMLVAMGYDAFPQLILAMDDDRLTRRVSMRWSTVGIQAVSLMEQISGERFEREDPGLLWGRVDFPDVPVRIIAAAATKTAVKAWWEEFKRKGEKRFLIDATRRGDKANSAWQLVEKYPDSALPAIQEGIRNSRDDSIRRYLVELAGKLKGSETVPLLLNQLRSTDPRTRIEAAWGLNALGRDEGFRAMLDDWVKCVSGQPSNQLLRDLVGFLMWSGHVETAKTLAKDLPQLTVENRVLAIGAAYWPLVNQWPEGKPFPEKAREIIDKMFVDSLEDIEELTGTSMAWEANKQTSNPRVCDIAADTLRKRLSRPALFDLSASTRTKNRQILELRNAWRQKHGQPPIPASQKKDAPLPEQQILPLLDQLARATNNGARDQVSKQILALGLPALPSAKRRLSTLQPGTPAHGALAALVTRLGCVVSEVEFTKRSSSATPELRSQIQKWKGAALSPADVIAFLTAFAKESRRSGLGLKLTIERDPDDMGLSVYVTFVGRAAEAQKPGYGDRLAEYIYVDGHSILGLGGAIDLARAETAEHWRDFADKVQYALETSPQYGLSIKIAIR